MKYRKTFASDNYAPIHPAILQAIVDANRAHAVAYGDDEYSSRAIDLFKQHFGEHVDVFFVCNGTAANVLSFQAAARSYQAIVCASTAHINVDECGAPEKYTGCKLLAVPTKNGKITVGDIELLLSSVGFQHHVQPKVISIAQPTELGTLYSCEEIKVIVDFAHGHGMVVHMDGARLSNAAVALNKSLKEITGDVGVDILSYGGTKNGLMIGEAIIFFNKDLARDFQYIRKQAMQLVSKMRFIAVQFEALLSQDLYLVNARQANAMAKLLASRIQNMPGVTITQPVETNCIFATLDQRVIEQLQQKFPFYVWNEQTSEVRWMCSFDTTEQDVDDFVNALSVCLNKLVHNV
jgi:threonine aldolase